MVSTYISTDIGLLLPPNEAMPVFTGSYNYHLFDIGLSYTSHYSNISSLNSPLSDLSIFYYFTRLSSVLT